MNLRLTLVKAQIEVTIALDEKTAPRAVEALWATTPCDGPILHSRRSGQEIFAILPPIEFPGENLVTSVTPGDVVLEVFPPYYRDNPPVPLVDPAQGYTHLGLVYGSATQWQTPEGYVPVTHVGRILSTLEPFSTACAVIRRRGGERFELTRA
jgi:Protein of unknown function (DUF3830)